MEQTGFLYMPGIKNIHMIGIDGISMSGLAEILINMGYHVAGSDLKTSARTERLSEMGAKIYSCHSEDNLTNADLVVYSAAIKSSNPEMVKAARLGIPAIDRAALLGEIMKKFPYSIAVSGTHGKSTTTSMVATVMMNAHLDPTVHIGAELQSIGGTTRIGGSQYFIAEACEYCGSFLKFHPFMGIILNIDFDHADYFRDIAHVKETFYQFASLIPENGYLIACADDENAMSVLRRTSCKKVTFGIDSPDATWQAKDITFDDLGNPSFTLVRGAEPMTTVKLRVPGMHNVKNALAAAAACYIAGCSIQSIQQGLYEFKGAGRRFEHLGTVNNIHVIDDYAHHPSEVRATLKAASNCRYHKLWCVFQPHTYTRTKAFLQDFAVSFANVDHVIVTDIYAAREVNTGEIHSRTLAAAIGENSHNALYLSSFHDIVSYLKEHAVPGDIIITMGAGDVYRVGEMFLERI